MSLEDHLVLARFFLSKLGVTTLEELRDWKALEDDQAPEDHTVFFNKALERAKKNGKDLEERLPKYDANLREYEGRLVKRRKEEFAGLKYFQYVTLLASEYHLDRLTTDPEAYVGELNEFRAPGLRHAQFTLEDLRRLAFYLATGAGKTLLLHVHYWQLLHYLEKGREKEALAPQGRFGNILLLVPNEGLAQQHLQDLERSGIPARYLPEVKHDLGSVSANTVLVVDMPKLRDKKAKDEAEAEGVYYPDLGQANAVFADEGHKGTGSLDKGWRQIREWLSEKGVLLEYSATFAQVLKTQETLKEYGKRILAAYPYRHFYRDGYGKDFQSIEAKPGELSPTHEEEAALMGGLLLYYLQLRDYRNLNGLARLHNLEKPLWVFVGQTVIKSRKDRGGELEEDDETLADVAKVVRFLKRLAEEGEWAQDLIRKALTSPKLIGDTNPFLPHLAELQEEAHGLYPKLLEEVMLGRGALELHLMPTQGEIGLKIAGARDYFGVINIGDTLGFKAKLEQQLGLTIKENPIHSQSLFRQINRPDSSIQLLLGSRKFVEGWSSWRVSTMTLLNIGQHPGPLIIQLFGRGVRLLGENRSLKRSGKPELKRLETLYVLGLNATYMKQFLEAVKSEGIDLERIQLQLEINQSAISKPLPLPRLPQGFRFESQTLSLKPDSSTTPIVTLAAKVSVLKEESSGESAKKEVVSLAAGKNRPLEPRQLAMLDWVTLRQQLLHYARAERMGNVSFSTKALQEILRRGWYRLIASESELADPKTLERAVLAVLRKYLSEYYRRELNAAQAREMRLGKLEEADLETHYEVLVPKNSSLLSQIQNLAKNLKAWKSEQATPIPRLYIDPSIRLQGVYQPLVYHTKDSSLPGDIQVKPAPLEESEYDFVQDLRSFWDKHREEEPFASLNLYLMRNAPKKGLGFHAKTGFYPDFILWVEQPSEEKWRIVFVEPHGMSREPIEGHPKLEVFTRLLPRLNERPEFKEKRILLDGYILTSTPTTDIPGSDMYNSDWERMAREVHLLVSERGKEANLRTIILGV